MRIVVCILLLVMCIQVASAAELHGIIYDLSLDPVEKVIVHISTQPQQKFITQDGSYTFRIKPGSYTLHVQTRGLAATENITIVDDGSYNLDLILYPTFEEEDSLIEELDFTEEVDPQAKPASWTWLYTTTILFLLMLLLTIFLRKKKKNPRRRIKQVSPHIKATLRTVSGLDTDAQKILSYLSEHQGRADQKEIRKLLPYSEAKVSLIISELVAKGLIEKVRHGRANIIKLK